MKTVEFVGPAGVGKSTIVGAVIRQLNVPVARREAYRVSSATALLRHPVWAARTLLFVCRAGGLRLLFSKAGANWFAVCGAALQARDLARRDRAVQLYDQLLLQALRRVARETKRSVVELARHYNRLVPLSDLIVAVQVPVAELERRLRARDGFQPPPMERERWQREVWRQWLDTRRALKVLQDSGRCRVLVIDGRCAPDHNAGLVERCITTFS